SAGVVLPLPRTPALTCPLGLPVTTDPIPRAIGPLPVSEIEEVTLARAGPLDPRVRRCGRRIRRDRCGIPTGRDELPAAVVILPAAGVEHESRTLGFPVTADPVPVAVDPLPVPRVPQVAGTRARVLAPRARRCARRIRRDRLRIPTARDELP